MKKTLVVLFVALVLILGTAEANGDLGRKLATNVGANAKGLASGKGAQEGTTMSLGDNESAGEVGNESGSMTGSHHRFKTSDHPDPNA